MYIGQLKINAGAALAPMAGISDAAMRRLCAKYGAIFTVSEMVSAKALTMGDKKSMQLLAGGGGEAPYGVQLFGQEPQVFYEAIRLLEDSPFDFIDINMGCPAPKIAGHGAGSALLKDPVLAGEIAKAAVQASRRPVTVKLRIGWDEDCMTGLEVAKRCQEAGVAMLAVHGRTREQQYTPGVNYQAVAEIKAAVDIPVLFNGDIASGQDAQMALSLTGCDNVMVGRAAVGDPFLFAEIAAALSGQPAPAPPTLRQRLAVLEEQVGQMCDEKGEERAMREARKIAAGYVRGLHSAAALRRCAHSLTYYTDLADLKELVYQTNG